MMPAGHSRLSRRILVIALLPMFFIATTIVILLCGLKQVDSIRERAQARRVAVLAVAKLLPDRIVDAINTTVKLSDPATRKNADQARMLWLGALADLDKASDSAVTHETIGKLRTHIDLYEKACIALGKGISDPQARGQVEQQAHDVVATMPPLIHELLDNTDAELKADGQKMKLVSLLRWIAAGGMLATLIGTLGSVAMFSIGVNRKLGVLSTNAKRFAAGERLSEPLQGDGEIEQLDRNFHDMAVALAAARHEEQAAINNSADLICALDQSLAVIDVNPACQTILGLGKEMVVGKDTSVLLAPGAVAGARAALTEMQATTELRQVETQLRTRDGGMRDALLTGFYSPEDRSTFCIIHDISRRKEIERLVAEGEAKERLLMERVPAGLITFGPDGFVHSANKRAAQLLQVAQPAQRTLRDCFGAGTEVSPQDYAADLLNKALGKVCTTNVNDRVLEVSVSAVNRDQAPEYLAIILDQTEREQFKQMRARFVSMIAHDIATPLTNIGGMFTLFAAGVHGQLNDTGLQRVQAVEAESHRLVRLFKDLLRAEKHGDVALEIGASTVQLNDLLAQAVAGVSEQAERQNVVIRTGSADFAVRVDQDRMVQVFVNLLTNALKFSPSGSSINIATLSNGTAVRITVSDNGPGIPESMLETIFEPFKQVSAEDATVRGGSGLGLAICKQIVTNHGGVIRAANRQPHGSVFTVELPL